MYVIFAGGGTDRSALQLLVNRVVADWSSLHLRANVDATLDHRAARTIFATGIRSDRAVATIQIVAVARDGGWYAVVLQSSTWEADSRRYFKTILDSLRFDGPPGR